MIHLDQSVCLNDTVICAATLTTMLKASLQATKLFICLKIHHVLKFDCNKANSCVAVSFHTWGETAIHLDQCCKYLILQSEQFVWLWTKMVEACVKLSTHLDRELLILIWQDSVCIHTVLVPVVKINKCTCHICKVEETCRLPLFRVFSIPSEQVR